MTVGRYCNGGATHANQSGKKGSNSHERFQLPQATTGYHNGGETHANRAGKKGGGARKLAMPAASTGYHNGGSYRAKS